MIDYGTALPAIQIPLLGNSAAVGLFSLLHIVLAALSVAFMLMAPLFEWKGRKNPFDRDLALVLTRFTVVVFSVSTVLAVIMVELMIGLFPVTTMWMWNHFRIPILFGVASFMLMLLVLYPYYHFWERLRACSITLHIALGALAAFFILPWVFMLDGMGAFMLTPVQEAGMWERLHNPTWLPLVIHRMVGNFMIAGYTLAAYGAWRASKPGDPGLEPYYQHLLYRGWTIGLGAFLLQPFTGLLYALTIHRAAPDAHESLMTGPYAPWLYAQVLFLALVFLGNDLLTKHVRTLTGNRQRWLDIGFPALAALLVLCAAYPELRRVCVYLLIGLTVWRLADSLAKTPTGAALFPSTVRSVALGLALLSVLLYLTMGVIRESSRRPDTVRGIISLQDELRHQARMEGALR
ncbi:MAG: conserved membrane protein of unknown function [Nitrospira sp.]|nr:MAG: conserved membrane protein of unknown function [Nitrospira sp.]